MKSESGHSVGQRRDHDRAFKAKLVQQCLQPGASASAIALEYGINANMLFTWRRAWSRESAAARQAQTTLLPVRIEPQVPVAVAVSAPKPAAPTANGRIEFEIAGTKLRVRANVQEEALRTVLRALREST